MFILEIPEGIQPLLSFLGRVLKWIYIGVPIALIVLVSFDMIKAIISNDEEEMAKVTVTIKRRVIASIAIFFIPTIVEVIFSKAFVSLNIDESTYKDMLSSYKSVIYSDKIDTQDDSKNKEISGNMKYSISGNTTDDNSEADFVVISKTMASLFFSKNRLDGLLKQVTTSDFLINYDDTSYGIGNKFNISYKSISFNEAVNNGEYIIVNSTMKTVVIGDKKFDEVYLDFYYQLVEKNYKLKKINIKTSKDVDKYIESLEEKNEDGDVIAKSKYASVDPEYDYSNLNALSKEKIKEIYDNNVSKMFMLSTLYGGGTISSATGFLVSDGIIATSWSYLQYSLMHWHTVLISDPKGNSYKMVGLVALDTKSDIAVIKLNKKVSGGVTFGDYTTLKKNDPVIAIINKSGYSLITTTGIVSSIKDNLINVLPLTKKDWGSPLFNSEGKVVGINTSKLVNSELSNASNIEGLIKLQKELSTTGYDNVEITSLENLKEKYFFKDNNDEEIKNSIPDKIWKKYKTIGNIEQTIVLDLVKASYYEEILSLRYHNGTSMNNMDFQEEFASKLISQGYKKVVSSDDKYLYEKGTSKVVIMSEFDYLIVVLVNGAS